MKKLLFFLVSFFLFFSGQAQNSFVKGSFVTNSGNKIDCYIKDMDWKNNPTNFQYKLSEDSKIETIEIESIKEFETSNSLKYIKAKVDIDRSSKHLTSLSKDENPVFSAETILLKVLVEGKASLYEYEDGSLTRYFYKYEDSKIEQLVYKIYEFEPNKVATNNKYKKQLWTNLKCSTINRDEFESLEYDDNKLTQLFVKYNKCSNSEYVTYGVYNKRKLFNFAIKPRISSSSLSIDNPYSPSFNTDFDSKISFGLGFEAEYILNFNNNKWSVIIEPTYQYYNSEKNNQPNSSVAGGIHNAKISYQSIEVPIGVRHYFYINENSKIFVNGLFLFDFNLKSSMKFTKPDGSEINNLEIDAKDNFAFGIGYKQNNKYSLEIRYFTSRNLLGEYTAWQSDYNTISMIFGYTIF